VCRRTTLHMTNSKRDNTRQETAERVGFSPTDSGLVTYGLKAVPYRATGCRLRRRRTAVTEETALAEISTDLKVLRVEEV